MFDPTFFKRRRTWMIWGAAAAVLVALYVTDPDNGANLKALVLGLLSGVLAIGLAHAARKALFDYACFDLSELIAAARQSPVGAGLVVLSVCMVLSAALLLFGGLLRV